MVFAEGYGIIGSAADPCWGIFVSHMQPTPTPHPERPPEEGARIFVLSAGQQEPTHIADGCRPALSPDGQRVAYSKDGNIFVINADGSQKTRLTNDAAHDSFPIWSPDSQRIAFARDGVGTRFLYVMSADGSGQTQLTDKTVNTFLPGMHYSWSPDGQKIAFAVQQGDGASIYIADADGSRLTPLARYSKTDHWPVWSPDGKKIAFVSYTCCASSDPAVAYPPPGGPPEIRSASDGFGGIISVVNADGSERIQLTDEGNGPPVWSPDGSSIAFLSMRDMRDRFADIYVMAADGSQQTRLVTVAANSPLAWSPDGQYLTFKAVEVTGDDWRQDRINLAILKIDGSQLIQLPI
jgi:Tol biopolymer transport system component